jgi:hypothetical protein
VLDHAVKVLGEAIRGLTEDVKVLKGAVIVLIESVRVLG